MIMKQNKKTKLKSKKDWHLLRFLYRLPKQDEIFINIINTTNSTNMVLLFFVFLCPGLPVICDICEQAPGEDRNEFGSEPSGRARN